MKRVTTIDLFKENMKFSAGHFTIFSETERENLHGHNFTVSVNIIAEIIDNGICFDYGIFKERIVNLCRELNETFLLPEKSKFLKIEEEDNYIFAIFNGEKIPFLKRDVTVIPVENTTVEELSKYLLEKLVKNEDELKKNFIYEITIKVFSGPGQCASYSWRVNE